MSKAIPTPGRIIRARRSNANLQLNGHLLAPAEAFRQYGYTPGNLHLLDAKQQPYVHGAMRMIYFPIYIMAHIDDRLEDIGKRYTLRHEQAALYRRARKELKGYFVYVNSGRTMSGDDARECIMTYYDDLDDTQCEALPYLSMMPYRIYNLVGKYFESDDHAHLFADVWALTTEAFYAKAYSTDYLAGVPDIVADKVFGILRQWSIRLEGTALRDCPKERKELTDMLC